MSQDLDTLDLPGDSPRVQLFDQQDEFLIEFPRERALRYLRLGAAEVAGDNAIRWVSHPPLTWAGVLARDSGRCIWCGHPAETTDHLIPKSAGGIDYWANGVAACLDCNRRRGHLPLTEWLRCADRGYDHPLVVALLYGMGLTRSEVSGSRR